MQTENEFVLATTCFLAFVVFLSSLMGQSGLVQGFNPTFVLNTTGIGVLDMLVFIINNIAVFFQLMLVSSDFALFSFIILAPITLVYLYIIMRLFRGGG